MSYSSTTTVPILLTQYSNYLTTPMTTASDYQNAARTLSEVFNSILRMPDATDLTMVWNFFNANIYGILKPDTVFQGVGVLNPLDRFNYTLIYSLFSEAIDGVVLTSVDTMATSVLQCPVLIQFLQAQAATIIRVATGSTQADAAQLTAYVNVVTSDPPETGVILQAIPTQILLNRDPVNQVLVYPLGNAQIENNGPAAAVIVESGGGAFFSQTSPIQFYADIA